MSDTVLVAIVTVIGSVVVAIIQYTNRQQIRDMAEQQEGCQKRIGLLEGKLEAVHQSYQDKITAMEKLLKDTERKYYEGAAVTEAFFENAIDAIFVVSQHGIITRMNASAELLVGASRTEYIGREIESVIPDRNKGKHDAFRVNYVRHPMPSRMSRFVPMSDKPVNIRRFNGDEIKIEVSLLPQPLPDGLVIIAICHNAKV